MKMKFNVLTSLLLSLMLGQHMSVIVTGGEPLTVILNGVKTVLTIAEVAASADNDVLVLDGLSYRLNSTWSFFGLHGATNYTIGQYATQTNCGCYTQICGGDCQQGIECHNTVVDDPPYFCVSWTTRRGFCISTVKTGISNPYTSYLLKHVATIALTEYGGPEPKKGEKKPFSHAGFTLKDQYQQNYSYNAMITDKKPRSQEELASYRYVESEGRIILIDDMVTYLTAPPKLTYDFKGAQCLDNGTAVVSHSLTQEKLNVHGDRTVFRSFVILRDATEERLDNIIGRYILSLDGVRMWPNGQKYFDILDPCNQQFLRVIRDDAGHYTIEVPAHQRLIEDNVICIAVNDVPSTQYDLVLYEIKNEGTYWTSSKRFKGLLSPDYLDSLSLRITTTMSDLQFTVSDAKIDIDIIEETDALLMLRLKTDKAIRCSIHLSKKCKFDLTTTAEQLYATAIIKDCDWFYEIAAYNCEGVFGTFYPPSKYVNAPISDFVENTTIHDVVIHSGDVVNIPDNNKSLFSTIAHWFVDWSPSNFLDKLLTIGILIAILVASFYVCLFCTEGKIGSSLVGSLVPGGLGGLIGGTMQKMPQSMMGQGAEMLSGVSLQVQTGGGKSGSKKKMKPMKHVQQEEGEEEEQEEFF